MGEGPKGFEIKEFKGKENTYLQFREASVHVWYEFAELNVADAVIIQ